MMLAERLHRLLPSKFFGCVPEAGWRTFKDQLHCSSIQRQHKLFYCRRGLQQAEWETGPEWSICIPTERSSDDCIKLVGGSESPTGGHKTLNANLPCQIQTSIAFWFPYILSMVRNVPQLLYISYFPLLSLFPSFNRFPWRTQVFRG